MKRLLPFLPLVFLLAACGVPRGHVRVSGVYEHMDQGDFLIFSPDGSLDRVDTIHIKGGEFEYQCEMTGDAVLRILYPNNDWLPVWVHEGDDIEINGDAQALREVGVEGNEENELFTQFRRQNAGADTLALRKAAAAFIRQHPASQVSLFLLSRYFIIPSGIPEDSVRALYKVIKQALPENNRVSELGGLVQQRYALQVGHKMPSFELVTMDSVKHTLKSYKDSYLVMYFWAGWQGGSVVGHHSIINLMDEYKKVKLLSYSLDVDSLMLKVNLSMAMDDTPVYCDFNGFSSKLVSQFGIKEIPFIILVGPDGKIKKLTSEASDVVSYIEKHEKKKEDKEKE